VLTVETFQSALKEAMRSGDEVRKRTLRMVLSAIKLAEVERMSALDEAAILGVLQKEVKARREAVEEAEKAGRQDLIQAAQAEIDVLSTYLPSPLSNEELDRLIRQVREEMGAQGPQDVGKMMKALMPRVQGRAEGKAVSDRVRALLSEQ
jgi:hypothetical protein